VAVRLLPAGPVATGLPEAALFEPEPHATTNAITPKNIKRPANKLKFFISKSPNFKFDPVPHTQKAHRNGKKEIAESAVSPKKAHYVPGLDQK